MFNVGGPEILVILLIALIVLGPQRLPSAARQVGRAMAEFRRVTSGFQAEVRDALNDSLMAPAAPPPDPAAVAKADLGPSSPRSDEPAVNESAPSTSTETAAAPRPEMSATGPGLSSYADQAPVTAPPDVLAPPEAPDTPGTPGAGLRDEGPPG